MRDFKKLAVWEKAHRFVLEIYNVTKKFPKDELFGIVSQIRRSSVSIPNNIAEGCGRNSKNEMFNFFNISMGSSAECEYLLLLSLDLGYLNSTQYKILNDKLIEVRKMLNTYMRKIKSNN
jgi:four helix bundle protein